MKNKTLSQFYLLMLSCCVVPALAQDSQTSNRLQLEVSENRHGKESRGTYRVFENRESRTGREIRLKIAVLHANGSDRQPDPIFFLAGGPGQGAADASAAFVKSPLRRDRDIVLVNQRGTGGDNLLQFKVFEDGQNIQQFIDPMFGLEQVRKARDALATKADLRMYSTPIAMDDLNEVRTALGYEKVNLIGGSYGTRAALVYIRRHPNTVRTATLMGVAPIPFTNPLFQAESAQRAIDLIFKEIESSETYSKHLPDLRANFWNLLERLEKQPAKVNVTIDGRKQSVLVTRESLANAIRFQMYYMDTSRKLPALLSHAVHGEMTPLIESSIKRNRTIGQMLAMGMLLSVTAAEDLARIDPDSIEKLTKGTFLGDGRVRRQIEAGKIWPKSNLPDGFGKPVQSDVPTLIFSGSLDPVTPPKWGELVHKNFPNSVHVVAPCAHDIGGPCIDAIHRQFLESGTVEGLNIDCVKQMKLPPLHLPKD